MSTAYYELAVQEDLDRGVGTTTKRNPGGGTLTGTQIGLHSWALGEGRVDVTWDPGEIANGASTTTTVTVPGAAKGDFATFSFSWDLLGLIPGAYVSDDNTVTVVLGNLTGAPVDLPSGTLSVLAFKSR